MSYDTGRVDKLLELAQRAVQKDDYSRALAILREASSLAPLRQDIRAMMAALLEETAFASEEPVRIRVEREEAAPPDSGEQAHAPGRARRVLVAGDEESPPHAGARQAQTAREKPWRGVAELPQPQVREIRAEEVGWHDNPVVFTEVDDGDDDAPPAMPERAVRIRAVERPREPRPEPRRTIDPPDSAPAERPPRTARMKPHSRAPRPRVEQDDDADIQSETLISRLKRAVAPDDPDSDDNPAEEANAELRRRRDQRAAAERRAKAAMREQEQLLEDEENEYAYEDRPVLGRFSRQSVAYAGVFSFIFLFVLVSSSLSYVKFFRQPGAAGAAKASTALPAAMQAAQLSSQDEGIIRLAEDYIKRERYDSAIELLAPKAGSDKGKPIHEPARILLASALFKKGAVMLRNTQENGGKVTAASEQKKLLASVDNYRKAAELVPDNAEYQLHLGNALFYCGTRLDDERTHSNLEDALSSINKAIELDRSDVRSYETLAWIYESLDKTAQARAAWTKFREMAPTKDDAQKASERLQNLSMAK